MKTLSVSSFRSNMASTFDLIDSGEQVLIRRGNHVYTILPIENDELDFSMELKRKIKQARNEYKEKRTLHFNNAKEAQEWMDKL